MRYQQNERLILQYWLKNGANGDKMRVDLPYIGCRLVAVRTSTGEA